MDVAESIRVRAEGNEIRRGIYRDFPTDYRDRLGNRVRVDLDVLGVSRDGVIESWHAQRQSNGVRIYIGSEDVYLDPGEYIYRIQYRTSRQLGFFDEHDELYWNVTGNGWMFPIDSVTASVRLPETVPPDAVVLEAYTGPVGSKGRDYLARVQSDGSANFRATGPLPPRSGLTIVVSWPKGHVSEPGAMQRAGFLLADNLALIIALTVLAIVLAYFVMAWARVGRDPEPGVIFPHYEPPQGFSPASMRYVRRMGYDAKAFSCAIINLAVKGYVGIDQEDDYVLSRQEEGDEPLAPGEQVLLSKLFGDSKVLALDKENHSIISAAMKAHRRALRRDYERIYFRTNSGLLAPGVLVLALGFAAVVSLSEPTPLALMVLGVVFAMHILFYYLLRAPTLRGRKFLDQVEGFRQYLEVAEKDELTLRNPPRKTPELFERFLPYALALGVEQAWAEKFASIFAALADGTGRDYQPAWYSGHWNPHHVDRFARGLGSSFSNAIASASTPPGSSSGGGGGGSSGGGGGGGGGGGW
jgi:uncharacterized membrane protein YgcG